MADYQLLVFDWDGTLVDSIARIVESMRVAADSCALAQLGFKNNIAAMSVHKTVSDRKTQTGSARSLFIGDKWQK